MMKFKLHERELITFGCLSGVCWTLVRLNRERRLRIRSKRDLWRDTVEVVYTFFFWIIHTITWSEVMKTLFGPRSGCWEESVVNPLGRLEVRRFKTRFYTGRYGCIIATRYLGNPLESTRESPWDQLQKTLFSEFLWDDRKSQNTTKFERERIRKSS